MAIRQVKCLSRVADHHKTQANPTKNGSVTQVPRVGITYLWTSAGWVYLPVVLDLFSRKVVGWSMSASPNTALILAALNKAVILREVTPGIGLLFHSDQGCQYTSHAYQDRLAELGIQASIYAPEGMSRRGNYWDNAVMERFSEA